MCDKEWRKGRRRNGAFQWYYYIKECMIENTPTCTGSVSKHRGCGLRAVEAVGRCDDSDTSAVSRAASAAVQGHAKLVAFHRANQTCEEYNTHMKTC